MQTQTFFTQVAVLLNTFRTHQRLRKVLGYSNSGWKRIRKAPTPWAKAAVRLAYINICLRAKNRELKQQLAKTAAKTNSQAKGRRSTKK